MFHVKRGFEMRDDVRRSASFLFFFLFVLVLRKQLPTTSGHSAVSRATEVF